MCGVTQGAAAWETGAVQQAAGGDLASEKEARENFSLFDLF